MKTLLRNKIIYTVTLLMLTSTYAKADWLADLNNKISANGPSAYNTQGGTYFSGGSYSFSAPNSSIKFVNAKAPSVSAGCSGINIDFGGFEFIDGEELIKFAKQVLGAAPGYAFNLAMQTLCPQCTDLMNTLTDTANMLNGLDLDSCEAAQMMVNAGFSATGITGTNKKTGETEGSFQKGMKEVNKSIKAANEAFRKMIDNKCDKDCPKEFLKGEATFLQMVFHKSKELQELGGAKMEAKEYNSGLINIVRAFIGDISIKTNDNVAKDDETEVATLKIIPAINGGGNLDTLKKSIDEWITGSKEIKPESLSYESLVSIPRKVSLPTTFGKEQVETFGYISYKNITSIEKAYNSRNSLTTEELAYLSQFKSPVYKILNTSSIDTHMLHNFVENFAVLSASQLAYETISRINKEILTQLVILEAEIASFKVVDHDKIYQKGIQDMRDNIRIMNEYSYSLYETAYAKFDTSMQELKTLDTMTAKMQAMMARHPVMGSRAFAQGTTR